MTADRRRFLAGLGATIVATACPAIAVPSPVARVLPPIMISPKGWLCTAQTLIDTISEIARQVVAMGPLSETEREQVSEMIDDCIDQVRPMGVLVHVEAEMRDIVAGSVLVLEPEPGTIVIRAES
jgi:hypothetical protein